MDNKFDLALEIFGVGMVTIFVILGLVVISGQLLIRLVNRFTSTKAEAAPAAPAIPDSHVAAISAAVEVITKGQGKVASIVSDK